MIFHEPSTRCSELCLISLFQLKETELSALLLGEINGRHSDATELRAVNQGDALQHLENLPSKHLTNMKNTWLQVKVQWEDDILQNILFLAITVLLPWHCLVCLLLAFFLMYCRGKKCIFTHLYSFQITSQLLASTAA